MMDSSYNILNEFEKEKLIKELREENRILLENHKRNLENEFKNQMSQFFSKVTISDAGNKSKSRANDADILDKNTLYFQNASKNLDTAPELILYDEGKRSNTIRAVQESTSFVPSHQVLLSKENNVDYQSSKIVSNTTILPPTKRVVNNNNNNNNNNSIPSQLRHSPFSTAVVKKIQKKSQHSKSTSALKDSSSYDDITADNEDTDHLSSTMNDINNPAKKSFHLHKDDNDDNIDNLKNKMLPATLMMIKKSEWLINDLDNTINTTTATTKSKKRNKSQKIKQKCSDSHISNSLQQDDKGDESQNSRRNSSHYHLPQLPTNKSIPTTTDFNTTPLFPTTRIISTSSLTPLQIDTTTTTATTSTTTSHSNAGIAPTNQLMSPWAGRTVHTANVAPILPGSEWENEIARHIISVYATTKAGAATSPTSRMLLTFAESSNQNATEVTEGLFSKAPLATSEEMYVDELQEEVKRSKGTLQLKVKEKEKEEDDLKIIEKKRTSSSRSQIKHKHTMNQEAKVEESDHHNNRTMRHMESMDENDDDNDTSKKQPLSFATKLRASFYIRTKDGGKLAVRGPPRCFPIWFVSTGDVYADWSDMPGGGGAELQSKLTEMFEDRMYMEYLELVESLMIHAWAVAKGEEKACEDFIHPRASPLKAMTPSQSTRNIGGGGGGGGSTNKSQVTWGADLNEEETEATEISSSHRGFSHSSATSVSLNGSRGDATTFSSTYNSTSFHGESQSQSQSYPSSSSNYSVVDRAAKKHLIFLWKQLVVTANAFAILCVERKCYNEAMLLLRYAEMKCGRDDLLPYKVRQELRAHVNCAFAFFFFKRKKTRAAAVHCQEAIDTYRTQNLVQHEAVALLRLAACHCQLSNFKESHKTIYLVLAMAEGGSLLATQDASAKQLCIVAIAYHNLAVVQLKMQASDAACKSSQNARKLARLCLSYSNRWLSTFHWTHQVALEDVQYHLQMMGTLDKYQLTVMNELTDTMFDPAPV